MHPTQWSWSRQLSGMGMEQGRGEAFPGTLCPQAFLTNPVLCQQQGACFQAL